MVLDVASQDMVLQGLDSTIRLRALPSESFLFHKKQPVCAAQCLSPPTSHPWSVRGWAPLVQAGILFADTIHFVTLWVFYALITTHSVQEEAHIRLFSGHASLI